MAWDIGKAIAAFGEAVTTVVADTAGSIYKHRGVGNGLPSAADIVGVGQSAWDEFGPQQEVDQEAASLDEDVDMQNLIQYLPEDELNGHSFPAERMEQLNEGMIDTRIRTGMEGMLGRNP
jgi:hypothetical protein